MCCVRYLKALSVDEDTSLKKIENFQYWLPTFVSNYVPAGGWWWRNPYVGRPA